MTLVATRTETFHSAPLSAVSEAIGVKKGTLRMWVKRGWVRPLNETPGRGVSRVFTMSQVLQVYMIHSLGKLGVPPNRATVWFAKHERDLGKLLLRHESVAGGVDAIVCLDGDGELALLPTTYNSRDFAKSIALARNYGPFLVLPISTMFGLVETEVKKLGQTVKAEEVGL